MSFFDNYEKIFHPEEPAAKTKVDGEALRNLIREEINNVIGGLAEKKEEAETKTQEQNENENEENSTDEESGESE